MTLDQIDINNYSFRIYDIDDSNKIIKNFITKEKIPRATKKELTKRSYNILKIINQHHILREGLNPIKFRELLEDLGPTFVKMGQILSKRDDLLPKEYCKELEKLCNDTNPLDYAIVKKVIEQELGKPLNDIFATFDINPLGSASISQVHKAILKTGESVVVKIQRPDIYELMKQDIMLFRAVIKPFRNNQAIKNINLYQLLNELWKITQQELNFFIEAINTIKFKRSIEKYPEINCPIVYQEYTTQKVLTMEYIDGISIINYTGDRKELGNRLAQNFISQILTEEFFHADPHQGNIIIRNNEIVWIDFGMIYRLTKQEQISLKKLIKSITRRDIEGIIQALSQLTISEKEVDHTKLYIDVEYLVDKYSNIDLQDVNAAEIINNISDVILENNLKISSSITVLMRALVTIEGVLNTLSGELNLMEILKHNIIKNTLKEYTPKNILEKSLPTAVTSIEKGAELVSLSNDMIKAILRGQAKLNLDINNTQELFKDFKHSLSSLFLAIIICAIIIGSSIIYSSNSLISIIGFSLSAIFGILLFIKQVKV